MNLRNRSVRRRLAAQGQPVAPLARLPRRRFPTELDRPAPVVTAEPKRSPGRFSTCIACGRTGLVEAKTGRCTGLSTKQNGRIVVRSVRCAQIVARKAERHEAAS